MQKIPKIFLQRLRILQDDRNVVQFATASGIPPQTMACYCKGQREPGIKNLSIICSANAVSADWLLGFTNERTGTAAPVADAELQKEVEDLKLKLALAEERIKGLEFALNALKR